MSRVLLVLRFWESEISHVRLPQREPKEGSNSNGAFQHLQKYSDPILQMVKWRYTEDKGFTQGGPVNERQNHDWKISDSSESPYPPCHCPSS